MGLDLVEMIMETEEVFNIQFDDEKELGNISTVGEFYNLTLKKIDSVNKTNCLSRSIFYKLRKMILQNADISKKEIKPSSKLIDILPKEDFKNYWFNLAEKTKYKLPELGYHRYIDSFIVITNVIAIILIIISLIRINIINIIFFVMILFIFDWLTIKKFERYKKYIPHDISRLSDLVKEVLKEEVKEKNLNSELSDSDVWDILVMIISDNLGVKHNEVIKSANFIMDLGAQ